MLAKGAGFSLHTAIVCLAYQRSRLERLFRCITRLPIATLRLKLDAQVFIICRYEQPYRDSLTGSRWASCPR
jgi:hypothetical protein